MQFMAPLSAEGLISNVTLALQSNLGPLFVVVGLVVGYYALFYIADSILDLFYYKNDIEKIKEGIKDLDAHIEKTTESYRAWNRRPVKGYRDY